MCVRVVRGRPKRTRRSSSGASAIVLLRLWMVLLLTADIRKAFYVGVKQYNACAVVSAATALVAVAQDTTSSSSSSNSDAAADDDTASNNNNNKLDDLHSSHSVTTTTTTTATTKTAADEAERQNHHDASSSTDDHGDADGDATTRTEYDTADDTSSSSSSPRRPEMENGLLVFSTIDDILRELDHARPTPSSSSLEFLEQEDDDEQQQPPPPLLLALVVYTTLSSSSSTCSQEEWSLSSSSSLLTNMEEAAQQLKNTFASLQSAEQEETDSCTAAASSGSSPDDTNDKRSSTSSLSSALLVSAALPTPPLFGKLNVADWDAQQVMDDLYITDGRCLPTVLLVRKVGNGEAFVADWHGPMGDTPAHISQSVLHYWYKWVLAPTTMYSSKQMQPVMDADSTASSSTSSSTVLRLDQVQPDLDCFWKRHGNGFLQRAQAAKSTLHNLLNPTLSFREKQHIAWLLSVEDANENHANTDRRRRRHDNDEDVLLVVFVKCGSTHESSLLDDADADDEYETLSQDFAASRNALFVQLRHCHGLLLLDDKTDQDDCDSSSTADGAEKTVAVENDGSIVALSLAPSVVQNSDWSDNKNNDEDDDDDRNWKNHVIKTAVFQPNKQKQQLERRALHQFCVEQLTPSILWYDRISVAPIAFADYRKVHAILFVQVDTTIDNDDDDGGGGNDNGEYKPTAHSPYVASRTAIQAFRRSCIHFRRERNDFVCLVVPHTERRILTTFGIDLWTPLDMQVMQGGSGPIQPVLPTLMMTDQRYISSGEGGMRRYYLDAADILTSSTDTNKCAIHDFMSKFWRNELTPAVQTSNRGLRINDSGVQVLTGASFPTAVLEETEKHTLLLLFAPTCGHCKRFSILWNELARLIQHVGWNSLIDVAKLDVTANEVIANVGNSSDDEKLFTLDVDAVPDIYYFPKGDRNKRKPIRYDVVDEFGDGAGRLNDPLEIIEWMLDVSANNDHRHFDESELLALLEQQGQRDANVSNAKDD